VGNGSLYILVSQCHHAKLSFQKQEVINASLLAMKKLFISLAIIVTGFSNVRATPVFSEAFNYLDGSIVANSGGVWIQNTGTSGTMLVTNQQLIVSASRSEDIAHQFSSVFETNGPVPALYSSFTLKCVGLPTLSGTYFAHFSGTNAFGLSGHRARIFASLTNGTGGFAGTGQFFVGVVNASGTPTNGQWATPLDTNVTYTVVTRYVLATGESTLWVNPAAESDPGATATDPLPVEATPTNGILHISHYGFRQAAGEGTQWIDDLKIGTQFNDVAGANTAPSISPIPNQNTPMNTALGPIDFVIGDLETPAGSLTLSNASSNPILVPTNNIVFGGSGADRTFTITPAAGEQGSATVTIYVSDGVNTAPSSFVITVGAPSISEIPNQITYSNVPTVAIAFTIGDAESPASSLVVSNASSNPSLIANPVLGGSGANRTVTLTPEADQTGVATITIYVSDGINVTSTSFVVSVSPKLGLLLTDDFSYTEFLQGTALLDATGSPWGHASGTNYDLQVIDGAAELHFQKSEDLAATLANGPFAANSGTVFYFGFTTVLTNLPSNTGNYFAHLKDSITGTTFRAKVYASTTNAALGQFRIGIANVANDFSAQFPSDLSLDQTNTVIVRYNSGTGESVLWVNPSSESSLNVSAVDNTTASQIGAFGLRQDSGIGVIHLDNLIVGTSLDDLASLLTAAPPLTPIPLNIQLSGSDVILSWTNSAFSLQSSSTVSANYETISGATSPYTNPITGSHLFFRLVHTNAP
jgi:hypothetical protein